MLVCLCVCSTRYINHTSVCVQQDSKRHLSSLPQLQGLNDMMKEITQDVEEEVTSVSAEASSPGETFQQSRDIGVNDETLTAHPWKKTGRRGHMAVKFKATLELVKTMENSI